MKKKISFEEEFELLFKNWSGEKYNTQQLQFFERLIRKKIEVAQNDISLLRDSIVSPAELTGDDRFFQSVRNEELINRIARLERFIVNLKLALMRLKNGTYGVCRESGEVIPPRRLFAVPHATTKVAYKK